MAYKGYKGITIKFGADTTQLGKALKDLDNQSKEAKKTVTELNKALKVDPTNVNLMSEKYKNLATQIDVTKKRIETLKSAESGLKSALAKGTEGAEDNWKAYQQELSRTETRLKTLENQSKQTTNALKSQLTGALSDIKSQLASVVKVLATAETAFVGLSAKAVKTGMDFDTSMSQVAATMGKTTDEITNLRDFAQQMGETTAFSASEAAQALNYMALAGYDSEKAMKALPDVLNLAAAGGLDLATASDMVTDAQSALGLSMEDTTKMVDQMATAASKSNTSVGQLGEAILTVGGTAKVLKGGTTEMATALGILADNGIKSAEGGTALRNIILALTAPMDNAAEELDKLGIVVNDENGNVRALNDIFNALSSSLDGMGTGERTQVLNEIFNKVDLKSVNALLSNCGQRFDELSGYIDKANGSAKQMANTQLDNLQGDLTLLKSAAEGLQIAVSDKLTPSFRDLAEEGTQEISKLTEEIKNGGLSDTFEQVGKDLSGLIKNGITTAAQMLPSVIKLLSGVTSHIDTIIKLLITYKGLNILSTTIKNITTIGSALKGIVTVLGSVEKAGALKSIVGVASKAGGAAAALGALSVAAGGVYLSYKAIKDYSPEEVFEMLDNKTQNVLTSTNELISSIDNVNQKYDTNLSSLKNQTKENQRLSDEIYKLSGNENLSAEQKEKLKVMIDQLNENIPTLNAKFDESTNSINLTKDATDELIKKQDEYNRYVAASGLKTDLYKQQFEIEQQIADTKDQINQKEKEIAEYQAKNGVGVTNDDRQAFFVNSQAVKQLESSLADLNNKQDDVKSKMKSVDSELKKNKNGYEELTNAAEDDTQAAERNAKAKEEAAKSQDELNKKYDDAKSELMELTQIQKELNEGQKLSTSQILDLIQKYPQLASAVRISADGYTIEAEALKKLTQERIKSMKAVAAENVQTLEAKRQKLQSQYTEQSLISGTGTNSKKFDINNPFASTIPATNTAKNNALSLLKNKTSAIDKQLEQARQSYNSYVNLLNDIENSGYKAGSSSASSKSSSTSSAKKAAYKSEEDAYKKHVEKLLADNDYLHSIGKKSDEEYYKYIKSIRDKYYKGNKKYVEEYRELTKQLYDYKQELAEKEKAKREEAIQKKFDDLEYEYNIGKISAEDYYKKLNTLNEKYYKNKKEYLEKYREINEKVQNGLKQAEEDRFNTLVDIQNKINDIKKAETSLTNARKQKVRLYSEQAGYQLGTDSDKVNSAKESLNNAQLSYIQTQIKNGNISQSQLKKLNNSLANSLPQLTMSSNSQTTKNETNKTSNNIVINVDKIMTNNATDFINQMSRLVKQTNNNRKVGKK